MKVRPEYLGGLKMEVLSGVLRELRTEPEKERTYRDRLSAERGIQRLDAPDEQYVSPGRGVGPELAATKRFRSLVRPGDVILSCSDGVFECHYGSPETSLTLADLESLFIRFSGDVVAYVEAISHEALMGVRGNPGGQDNIAIVASVI